ncbi:MAG: YcgN family cysteine cluster protein [Pseudomonadota bacterium]
MAGNGKNPENEAARGTDAGAARPFWERKRLSEMSPEEWESLCDGCGRCCLVLLADETTDEVWETDVACALYDAERRRCTDYANRSVRAPDCVRLTPENAGALAWMPETCAYRRLARGQSLPEWHPLITGDPTTVARAGAAASKRVVSERAVADDDLEDRIVRRR